MISIGSRFTPWTQSYEDLQEGKSGLEHENEWCNLAILPFTPLDTEPKLKLHKTLKETFMTSSESLMYFQFMSCVQGVKGFCNLPFNCFTFLDKTCLNNPPFTSTFKLL